VNTLPIIDSNHAVNPTVVVVALDFDSLSATLFEAALGFASSGPYGRGLALHVIHVAAPTPEITDAPRAAVLEESPPVSQELERLRLAVDEILEAVIPQGEAATSVNSAISHLRIGDPAREIAQLASDMEAHLIVMGRGANADNGMTSLGPVAQSVSRFSPCPTLLVPPKTNAAHHVEPPCPDCKAVRRDSNGASLWCTRHLQRYGERHHYHHATTRIPRGKRSGIPTR
jgi:nucleotide-binding universal stress UspA family protein